MRLLQAAAIAVLSRTFKVACSSPSPEEPKGTLKFEFTSYMRMDFNSHVQNLPAPVLQFIMPSSIRYHDLYGYFPRGTSVVTVEIAKVAVPDVKGLRDDLPRYFCQPLLGDDELRLMADLFSDRLEEIVGQIKASTELSKVCESTLGLVRIALFMALPPICSYEKKYFWYYPQELLLLTKSMAQYRDGHKRWREALEKAHNEGLKYEGPIPDIVQRPVNAVSEFWQENWRKLPTDVWLYVLCMTESYIWHVRLVCRTWRSLCNPQAMVAVLGYGRAFKMLSGRVTFGELSTRLDSLAQMALTEFNRASAIVFSGTFMGLKSKSTKGGSTGKWGGVVNGLKEIIQIIDPLYALSWYRDARLRLPGLNKVIETDIFAPLLSARDDTFISMLLEHILYRRFISEQDLGWNDENRGFVYRLVREYVSKYPEAANGHPLPDRDTSVDWSSFKGI